MAYDSADSQLGYVNLDSVHIPGDGDLVPAAWGHQIKQNFAAMKRPNSFYALGSAYAESDNVTELRFSHLVSDTGGFFTAREKSTNSFTVPTSGFYYASLSLFTPGTSDPPPESEAVYWLALMFKDDTDDGHYILRTGAHLNDNARVLSGLVRVEAGTTLSFVVYQNTGNQIQGFGWASMIYLGRNL